MRRMVMVMVGGVLLCGVSGCVVHDGISQQAPMWWPAFMVRQSPTEGQWGGQSIYGGDRLTVSKQGVGVAHAEPEPWMQSIPTQPAQPQ